MKVAEMKLIYEKCSSFEKPNLICDGGFGYGKGTLSFNPQDGEYHFGDGKGNNFIANEEFVNKIINQNMRRLKDYFAEEEFRNKRGY